MGSKGRPYVVPRLALSVVAALSVLVPASAAAQPKPAPARPAPKAAPKGAPARPRPAKPRPPPSPSKPTNQPTPPPSTEPETPPAEAPQDRPREAASGEDKAPIKVSDLDAAERAVESMRRAVEDARADQRDLEEEILRKKADEESRGIAVLPALSYAPESGFSFGAFGMYFWHFGVPARSRTTSVRATAIYTTLAQVFLEGGPDVWLADNAAHFNLYGGYSNAPYYFFGIGNSTRESNIERFTERRGHVSVLAQPRIFQNFYAGVKYRFDARDIVERQAGRELATGAIAGSAGVVTSGGGAVFTYDTRDRVFGPLGGTFAELSYNYYPSFLGSQLEFGQGHIDLRQYFPLFGDHVLAFQLQGTASHGTVPFYLLSQIGGDGLRGIFLGRYRDNHMLEGQVEYRYPIFWRIGGTAFLGAGAVGRRVQDLPTGKVHPGYGMGIRYALAPAEGLNVRVDVGYGDEVNFYIDVAEAF